jgi:hypothetical protein
MDGEDHTSIRPNICKNKGIPKISRATMSYLRLLFWEMVEWPHLDKHNIVKIRLSIREAADLNR